MMAAREREGECATETTGTTEIQTGYRMMTMTCLLGLCARMPGTRWYVIAPVCKQIPGKGLYAVAPVCIRMPEACLCVAVSVCVHGCLEHVWESENNLWESVPHSDQSS